MAAGKWEINISGRKAWAPLGGCKPTNCPSDFFNIDIGKGKKYVSINTKS
jgi:hypothetical protein